MYSPRMKLATAATAMLALLFVGAALLGGPSIGKHSASAASNGVATAAQTPRSATSRIEVVVMENKRYKSVIGNANAPYTNRLARRYGLATRMFSVTHPSLPNYLAMTTGSTHRLHSDFPAGPYPGPDLMTQLGSAGSTWQAYFAVPHHCYTGPALQGYSKGLNPFIVNRHILASRKMCSNLKPLSRLSSELHSGTLPDLAWISPSLSEDSHNSTVKAGDNYLSKLVPRLIPSLGPKGALFIIWDEGKGTHGIDGTKGGGHIPAIVVGPGVRPGARTSTPMTSYSMLHFIEHSYELPYLGHAASASDAPLRSLFATPPSPHRGS